MANIREKYNLTGTFKHNDKLGSINGILVSCADEKFLGIIESHVEGGQASPRHIFGYRKDDFVNLMTFPQILTSVFNPAIWRVREISAGKYQGVYSILAPENASHSYNFSFYLGDKNPSLEDLNQRLTVDSLDCMFEECHMEEELVRGKRAGNLLEFELYSDSD